MLKVENLCKSFNKNEVLHNINLSLKEGERVVIIGPSGCGKSTLLRTIDYIEEPTSGNIYFDNKLITKNNVYIIRQLIGMVFQSFNLFNNLNIIDNLTIVPVLNKIMDKDQANEVARNYLKQFDLVDKEKELPQNLSGGEKQRVAIIRQLILNPKLIMFDEPTSALDPVNKQDCLNIIKKLSDRGIAVIVVTHDINFIKDFASRIIYMEDGNIIIDDEVDKVLRNSNPKLQDFLKEFK